MQGSFAIRLARTGEFLLGALFLSAAVLKLANVPLFASQILSYEVITNPKLVALAAEILVPLEAALGLAMLAGIRLRGAIFYAAIAMLLQQQNRRPGTHYTVRQGTAMGRDGRVLVDYDDATGKVWIGGTSLTVVDGTCRLS